MQYQAITHHIADEQIWSQTIHLTDFLLMREAVEWKLELLAYKIHDQAASMRSIHSLYVSIIQDLGIFKQENGFCFIPVIIRHLTNALAGCNDACGTSDDFEEILTDLHDQIDRQLAHVFKGLTFNWVGDQWSKLRTLAGADTLILAFEREGDVKAGLAAISILCEEVSIHRCAGSKPQE